MLSDRAKAATRKTIEQLQTNPAQWSQGQHGSMTKAGHMPNCVGVMLTQSAAGDKKTCEELYTACFNMLGTAVSNWNDVPGRTVEDCAGMLNRLLEQP